MKIKLNIRIKSIFVVNLTKRNEKNSTQFNKRFSRTIKPLSDKCIQSFAITLINNENVIPDDFKLAQTLNNYFKSAVGKLGIKKREASSNVNGVDVATEKYKDHPSIKMINENVSFESRFSFKKYGSLVYKKRFLILIPRKWRLS